MKYTPQTIGKFIRNTRKAMKVTQQDLAYISGTGQRFISDLENGKATCQLGKTLTVLHTLGIKLQLTPPIGLEVSGYGKGTASSARSSGGSG